MHILRKYSCRRYLMKQSKLVKELYNAFLFSDNDRVKELRQIEFKKIARHKEKGKYFGPKWMITDI